MILFTISHYFLPCAKLNQRKKCIPIRDLFCIREISLSSGPRMEHIRRLKAAVSLLCYNIISATTFVPGQVMHLEILITTSSAIISS